MSRIRSLFTKGAELRERTDINALIGELARLIREEAIRHNVAIKLRLSSDIPQLSLDLVQIQQVLLNLAMNAMEAMAEASAIRELEISSEIQDGREVVVTVRDHGIGLSEQIRERVFDPFVTTKPEGTGMGLAICRSIIEAHDGRIWAEALDGGTAFRFSVGVKAR